MRGAASLIFRNLEEGDRLLFLYEDGIDVSSSFRSFIESGLEGGHRCLYAFNHVKRLATEQDALLALPIRSLGELRASLAGCTRFLIDFGRPGNLDFMGFEKMLAEESGKRPLAGVSAYDLASLDPSMAEVLMRHHDRAVVSSRKEFTAFLPARELPLPKDPKVTGEEFVKKNLEIIMLSLIKRTPMGGYDIINEVSQRYRVFLGQGMVYPLLYSLRDSGLLKDERTGRTRKYFLTQVGEEVLAGRIEKLRAISDLDIESFVNRK